MSENYIEIRTDNIPKPVEHAEQFPGADLLAARANAAQCFAHDDGELSIAVIAYNRLEQTRVCIENLIRHTHMPFRLLLIDSGSEPDVMAYFQSVDFPDKRILRITKNISANHAFLVAMRHLQSRYCAIVPNDVVITPNAIENLYACISSSDDIGWVSPMSSNVSNFQQVNLEFTTPEEMHAAAAAYNRSDPLKWHERPALMPAVMMYRKECIDIVGGFDYGFAHNFADDDMARRFCHAGYKTILCTDTWVHHDHTYYMSMEDATRYRLIMHADRMRFQQKYNGLDAWVDMRNYERSLISILKKPDTIGPASLLGVDTRVGTPILELKNTLRGWGITDVGVYGFTTDAKYFSDLRCICRDVACGSIEHIGTQYASNHFDYILLGEPINVYSNIPGLAQQLFALLRPGGTLLLKLRNTCGYETLQYVLGDSGVVSSEQPMLHITAESLAIEMRRIGFSIAPVTLCSHPVPTQQAADSAQRVINAIPSIAQNDLMASRLLTYEYLILATKPV